MNLYTFMKMESHFELPQQHYPSEMNEEDYFIAQLESDDPVELTYEDVCEVLNTIDYDDGLDFTTFLSENIENPEPKSHILHI